jgi:sulfite exporter TauE/SafE
MVAYGLGTTPVLVGIWWSAARLSALNRRRLTFLAPAVLAVTGVLLIGRGLGGGHAHPHSALPGLTAPLDPHHAH